MHFSIINYETIKRRKQLHDIYVQQQNDYTNENYENAEKIYFIDRQFHRSRSRDRSYRRFDVALIFCNHRSSALRLIKKCFVRDKQKC